MQSFRIPNVYHIPFRTLLLSGLNKIVSDIWIWAWWHFYEMW